MTTTESAMPASRPMVRNIIYLGLGQTTTTVLSIMISAIVARTLGASEFGVFYLISSIAAFGYVFVDWGHAPYVMKEIARCPEKSGLLMGSVLAVRTAMALAVSIIAALTTWALGYDLRTRFLVATLVVAWLPMYLGLSYSWAFRGHERMDYDAMLNVVLKLTTLIAAVVVLSLGGRLLTLISSFAVGGLAVFALATFFYRRLRLPPLTVTLETARELVCEGTPMLAMSLAITVQPYIDANLLYKLAPSLVVGWYGAAWTIAGTLVAPASIFTGAMYPRWAKASHSHAAFMRALREGFRPLLFVAVLGAVGTYLFADVAVAVVYTKRKFGPAANILQAFAPALLLIYIDISLGYAILAFRGAWRLAGAKVAAVILTTGLELILIPWFQLHYGNGGIGVVIATAAGEMTMVAAALVLIRDSVDVRMAADFLRGLVAGLATVLVMKTIAPLPPPLAIPCCVLVFLALAVAIGLVNLPELASLTAAFERRSRAPQTVPAGPAGGG
jgi:O-antigen/teichoic acid export membrane protein